LENVGRATKWAIEEEAEVGRRRRKIAHQILFCFYFASMNLDLQLLNMGLK